MHPGYERGVMATVEDNDKGGARIYGNVDESEVEPES